MSQPLSSRPENAARLIGTSRALAELEDEIRHAARSDSKILITGESGVGKELVARRIHAESGRRTWPLVTINCAGLPDSLLESELFGHERGSFTGAHRDRAGLFESARGGTIFMDEVGEMSLRMQALLLRFMETGEIQRVGGTHLNVRADVRVIAATNRNLVDRMASGDFREDLYYRLNVIHIVVPPLRERREDIPLLFAQFLTECAASHKVPVPEISPDLVQSLMAHTWPGNIRELKNVAERMLVLGRGGRLPSFLPIEGIGHVRRHAEPRTASPAAAGQAEALFERMVRDGESFWDAVYAPFMSRDLTRDCLRQIVARGLKESQGSYRLLIQLFNMKPGDYKRFLNVLTKHDCHMAFQRFRSLSMKKAPGGDDTRAVS